LLLQGEASATDCGGAWGIHGTKHLEALSLSRQISALKRFQQARGCDGTERGMFNACASLARRLAQASRSLGAMLPKGARDGGCRPREKTKPKKPADVPAGPPGLSEQRISPGVATFCVRLSDGYRFPTPNSRYMKLSEGRLALDACRYICETPDMALYVLSSVDAETTDMVEFNSGRKYLDLKTANLYQESSSFKACNFQRYYESAKQVLLESVAPPAERKAPGASTSAGLRQQRDHTRLEAAMAARPIRRDGTDAGRRRIRVVGPSYLDWPAIESYPATAWNQGVARSSGVP